MRNRQSLTKLLMFMLPAVLTIAAYSTFYDNLFSKPGCKNCNEFTQHSSQANQFDLRKILDLIDQLRMALAHKDARTRQAQKTPLDLALLQEKFQNFGSGDSDQQQPSVSDINEKVNQFLAEDKPLTVAKNDSEELKKEFILEDNTNSNNEPTYISRSPGSDSLPPGTTYLTPTSPDKPTTNQCTGLDCNQPPPTCNSDITPGCVIDPPSNDGPGTNPGDSGSHSAVPLPTSGYLLLTGIFVIAFIRFKKLLLDRS